MDYGAAELWRHAPGLLITFQGIAGARKDVAKASLLEALGLSEPGSTVAADESKPGVEDFEYALQNAVLDRLESGDDAKVLEVADILDASAAVVLELFVRAAKPGVFSAETERCKTWWSMLLTVAEDASRLVPVRLLDRFVTDWEASLQQLRAAYLQLAGQRLLEFDAKQEAEQKAAEQKAEEVAEAAASDAKDTKKVQLPSLQQQQKEAKDRESKRIEERKKVVTQLGVSPNGQLYLTLTSLLKQLSSRLCSSLHAPLRARIVLLLERLLAMDHKAIANNQKLRTQEYVQAEDLDAEADATLGGVSAAAADSNGEVAKLEGAAAAAPEAATAGAGTDMSAAAPDAASGGGAAASSGSGSEPQLDFDFYQGFWSLQESLQYPDKLFDKAESWPAFQKSIAKVLNLFLRYPAQDDTRQPWTPPEPIPLRHAPRVRALSVQLEDPGFRLQFLTQVMIAFQALEQDGSRRGDTGGLISRQADKPKAEFIGLKRVCEMAIGKTRNDFLPALKLALEREAHWVSWKGYGCREFERESLEMLNGRIPLADAINDLTGMPQKQRQAPRLTAHVTSLLKTLKDPQWKVQSSAKSLSDEEASKAMRSHAMRAMCDSYLDRLLEEERPDSSIEEEYKAKKNKVLMWQCRRLFCQQYLRVYAQKEAQGKTDFMDFVQIVKGRALQPTEGAAEVDLDGEAAPATTDEVAELADTAAEPLAADASEPSEPADAPAAEPAGPAPAAAGAVPEAPEVAVALADGTAADGDGPAKREAPASEVEAEPLAKKAKQ